MANAVLAERANSLDTDGVLSSLRWDSLKLTFSFPREASFYGASYGLGEPQNNFEPLNTIQVAAARSVFSMIASVTNLSFMEIEETASIHADLRLAMSDVPASALSHTIDEGVEGGDVWFGNSTGRYDTPVRGDYAFWTLLHEIGHTLGLKHGHEEGGFGVMTAAQDSMEFSVMTYRSYVGSAGQFVENETWGYAQTPMMHDIAALQHMYGANFSTNSGNTTYRWSPTTGEAFIDGVGQGAPGGNRIFMTIWDGGGVDTYDFANYRASLTVDLSPGAWSRTSDQQVAYLGDFFHFARGNIANALLYQGDPRSLIENAIGGTGNDRLSGNVAENVLKGGSGSDHLYGHDGADTLAGGLGHDVLRGGDGADTFLFDKRPHKTTNVDKIIDFDARDDCVYLDNAIFKALGKGSAANPQKVKNAFFTIGDHAKDANDFVIYDAKKGVLFYDADGSGGGEAVQFATLSKKLKMTSADFFVV